MAMYDLCFYSTIETVMESLKKGECLKGASGTIYRLSNSSREGLSLESMDVWDLYMDVVSRKYRF